MITLADWDALRQDVIAAAERWVRDTTLLATAELVEAVNTLGDTAPPPPTVCICATSRRCDVNRCEKPATWVYAAADADPVRMCSDHRSGKSAKGWARIEMMP